MESFMVRVWVPGDGDGQAEGRLRGQLIRLTTGITHTFHDTDELMALLRQELGQTLVLPETTRERSLDDAAT